MDDDANGFNNGSSWQTAYKYLQDALTDAKTAEKPVEIRVAQGLYRPDQGANQRATDQEATFKLIDGVTLKGGYTGLGTADPNVRDIKLYESILSGDLAANDSPTGDPRDMLSQPTRLDNSHHIVTANTNDSTAVIEGFIIAGGHAEPNVPYKAMPYDPVGGGLYNVHGSPTVLNCIFRANLAGNGGAVYSEGGSLQLIQCEFHVNAALLKEKKFADRLEGWYGQGGGVDTERGILTIEKCRFTDNLAAKGGGVNAIGWRGSVPPGEEDTKIVLTDCIFLDNRATTSGGGVFVESMTPVLTRCIFARNSADTGGAIYSLGGTGLITACSFTANSAGYEGGGMANSLTEATVLTNCTFVGNSTGAHGGGICNSQSTVRMSNSRLSGNSTGVDLEKYGGVVGGGAIYNTNDCNVLITNCTFSGNKGFVGNTLDSLGRLSWPPSIIRLTNCVLWDGEGGIANRGASRIAITYSTVQGGSPGEGNIDADPLFANPGHWDPNGTPDDPNDDFWVEGDYHLKSLAGRWDPNEQRWVMDDVSSPCIDAGDPNSPVSDEPEPNGGRINMGTYGGTVEASKSRLPKTFDERLQDLLATIEGQTAEEPTVQTLHDYEMRRDYVYFLAASSGTCFAVDPAYCDSGDKASDWFLAQWRDLLVDASKAVSFDKYRVTSNAGRTYVRYRQEYAGLEIYGASVVIQADQSNGIVIVASDIQTNVSSLDTGVVPVTPFIDGAQAQDIAIASSVEGYRGAATFEALSPILMIYAPTVLSYSGPIHLVWSVEVYSVTGRNVRDQLLVDAHDGKVVLWNPLIVNR